MVSYWSSFIYWLNFTHCHSQKERFSFWHFFITYDIICTSNVLALWSVTNNKVHSTWISMKLLNIPIRVGYIFGSLQNEPKVYFYFYPFILCASSETCWIVKRYVVTLGLYFFFIWTGEQLASHDWFHMRKHRIFYSRDNIFVGDEINLINGLMHLKRCVRYRDAARFSNPNGLALMWWA